MDRLEKKLLRRVGRASRDWELLEPGDRVLVGLSGGKDSYAMMRLLDLLRQRAPFDFELVACNLDQGQPGFSQQTLVDWCEANDFTHHMIYQDTYSVVLEHVPADKTYCSLCSRLRRGILYTTAAKLGCTKIALGHHRDDAIETLLLNLFYSGQIKSMPPRLRSDDGRNTVIRPLAYCAEEDLAAYAQAQAFPILPCDLCGSQDNLKRQQIKRMLAALHADNDNVKGNLFAALGNIVPSHLFDQELQAAVGEAGTADVVAALQAIEGGCSLGA